MNEWFDAIAGGDQVTVDDGLARNPELLNARNRTGVSGVAWAMYHGQAAIAHMLVERGATLDIFDAAIVGDDVRLQTLLAQNPAAVNEYSRDGFQPLGLAAFFGQEAAARLLLKHGAAVNSASQNHMQVMPLHSAAAGQHLAIAKMLLEHGADVNAEQRDHFRPLDSAIQNKQQAMIELLHQHGATSVRG